MSSFLSDLNIISITTPVNKIILRFNIKISICLNEYTLELYTNKTFLIINRISIFLSLD